MAVEFLPPYHPLGPPEFPDFVLGSVISILAFATSQL